MRFKVVEINVNNKRLEKNQCSTVRLRSIGTELERCLVLVVQIIAVQLEFD